MTIIFVTFYGNGYGLYRPAGKRTGEGLAHTVRNLVYSCAHAPPSKISSAVKTTCERIAPSKSFLGAVYNHGRLYFTRRHWLPYY